MEVAAVCARQSAGRPCWTIFETTRKAGFMTREEVALAIAKAVQDEREACAKIAAGKLGGYLCPYGRDKPGDPTWSHKETDKCPVCGLDANESLHGCHDTVGARIAALIRNRDK